MHDEKHQHHERTHGMSPGHPFQRKPDIQTHLGPVGPEQVEQLRPLEFLRVPVYHDDGQPKGLAGVAWDVTERYEAEERQRLITHFFEHASDAVLILDEKHRVLTLNRAATAISGYELEDLKGKFPRMFIEASEDPAVLDAITKSLLEHGSWRGELGARRKDGSPLPIYCNVSSIPDDDGKVINWAVSWSGKALTR